ncbi:MAG: argininosuccinate synthase [Chloroflexi bacterium]|nr:argininosuccinate synthase [Chloroflexota bacterium]
MAKDKILLAYSGGLDTSVAVPWLQENYNAEVITLTIDLGMVDLESIRQRGLQVGAVKAMTVDGRETLVNEFLFPALQAGAIYEEKYPLATALGRPLIARYLAEAAQSEGAYAVAHGCTGKGNDQVRIEVGIAALAPKLKVIAPIREWGMSREDEIEYGQARNLPINASQSRFSVDENLWGRSAEAGELEDPWQEPPEEAFAWTKALSDTPMDPAYLEIHFELGIPTQVDGESMAGIDLISHLNTLAGAHGVGRVDHVENRLVGIKSREIYEAPAATVLHAAHQALETLTLTKEQARTKAKIAQEYADVVYNGLWFTHHRQDLDAYVRSTQRYVTGDVRVRLHRGTCMVVGRRAPQALYQYHLATYDRSDQFDHAAAEGFISIYGLPVRTQNQVQSG